MTNRLALLLIAALPLAGAACSGSNAQTAPAAEPAVVPVRIAPVMEEVVAPPVVATGVLAPKEEITLSFKVGGVIGRLPVDEGEAVRAGDTLAALDLREIDANVTRAQSAVEKAARDSARAHRLFADSVATLAQVQDASTGLQVARADLETARFNRQYAVIVAPANGVILRRLAEPNELTGPGTPVLVLGSRARGSVVRVGLADRDAVRVHRGDRATVAFDAFPARPFSGAVAEIGAAADPATGTYAVEIAVPGAAQLPAGLVGHVEIQPGARSRTTLVPVEALLEVDGARATVFTLAADERTAERRQVVIAFLLGDRVAVATGLERARAVVTDGAAYLEHGDAVRIVP